MITLFEDTGQVLGKHILKNKYWEENGVKVIRQQLNVGDYTLPANQSICVDTKKDCSELYMDLISDHPRFHDECVRAQDFGIQLYILVENTFGFKEPRDIIRWKNPQMFKWYNTCRALCNMKSFKYKWDDVLMHAKAYGIKLPKQPCTNVHLIKVMSSMEKKYGVKFLFCSPFESGKRVLELLGVDLDG